MIQETNTVQVQTQGALRSESMRIDQESLVHVMRVLANLYSDPEMAVIREYMTNARDGHVAAGTEDVAIDVRLPNAFESSFTIRDYGIGLSEDEIYSIYGSYGASTKRESNSFTGQLGFGSKSAFSYVKQFTVTTIKNGIKGFYSLHLDADGAPTITKLGEVLTDERNGVEVKIPVKSYMAFRGKFARFATFFGSKINVLDETFNIPKLPIVEEFDNALLVQRPQVSGVVMGGVFYPLNTNDFNPDVAFIGSSSFIIYANIGDVSFAPSREQLLYNQKTKDFLVKSLDKLRTDVTKRIQDKISAAKNLTEAAKIYQGLTATFTTYMIRNLRLKFGDFDLSSHMDYRCARVSAGHRGASFADKEYIELAGEFVLVGDVKLAGKARNALKAFANEEKYRVINLLKEIPDFLKDSTVYTLEEIIEEYYEPPVRDGTASVTSGVFKLANATSGSFYGLWSELREIPEEGSELVFVELERNSRKDDDLDSSSFSLVGSFLQSLGYSVYGIRRTKMARIKKKYSLKEYKTVFLEAMETKKEEIETVLDKQIKHSLSVPYGLRHLDTTHIKDREFAEFFKDYQVVTARALNRDESSLIKLINVRDTLVSTKGTKKQEIHDKFVSLMTRYPLLELVSISGPKQSSAVVEYINLVHERNNNARI